MLCKGGQDSRVQTILGLQKRFQQFGCANAEQVDVLAKAVSFSLFFSSEILSVRELVELTSQLVAKGNGGPKHGDP